jgi:hypothetical protein
MTNDLPHSIVLVSPTEAGSPRGAERYFSYSGTLSSLKEIAKSAIRSFEVCTKSGSKLVLPFVHGRFLQPRFFGTGSQDWAIFSKDAALWIEARGVVTKLSENAVIRADRFACVGRVLAVADGVRVESYLSFPYSRVLFLEGDEDHGSKECDPTLGTFAELASPSNRTYVASRWNRGIDIAYRSTDIVWESQRAV